MPTGLQRYEEALQAWQRAVDVDGQCGPNSIHDLLYVWRSEVFARQDDLAGASAAVEELASLAANDKTRLHGMAVICAGRLAAVESDTFLQPADKTRVAQHLVDATILFLRRAHKAGFFESPWQIGFLQIDQRFRPLHERDELQKLIEEFHAQ